MVLCTKYKAIVHQMRPGGARPRRWIRRLVACRPLSMAAPAMLSAQTAASPEGTPEQVPSPGSAAPVVTLPPTDIVRSRVDLPGDVSTASQGTVTLEELNLRQIFCIGRLLETVPGLVVTVHFGEGTVNQYLIRAFNLDHGTYPANCPVLTE